MPPGQISTTWDAIVVGAGFGGVTAAAKLASSGRRVLVVDKNARPGGKAMTVSRHGLTSELWPVSGGPTRSSAFDDLIELVGMPHSTTIEADPGAEFIYLAPDRIHRSVFVPSHPVRSARTAWQFARGFDLGLRDMFPVGRMHLAAALARGSRLEAYDTIDMLSWLRGQRLPPVLLHWLASLMNLFFVVPVDQLPASEGILTLREVLRGGAGRYHCGGYGSVAEAAITYVQAHGGAWMPRTRVDRVLVRDGQVCGVLANDCQYTAPVVISNAGLQPTVLSLTESSVWPSQYLDWARSLQPSLALVGMRYELSRPIFRTPMTVIFSPDGWWDRARYERAQQGQMPHQPLTFVTVPALYDPALASPSVPQLALTGVLSSPDPTSDMHERALRGLETMLTRLWPELGAATVRAQVYDASHVSLTTRDSVVPGQGGECIGLAQVIGQSGSAKPAVRTPVRGLYFAGCDAGAHGIGTTQAVASGFVAAAAVMTDWPQPRAVPT